MKRILLSAVIAIVVIGATVYGLNELSGVWRFQIVGDVVVEVPTHEKVVALTFDDGPHKRYTNDILDILEEHDVHATFFMVGENIARLPDVAKRVSDEGHELGNHSYTHRRMLFKSKRWMREEIDKTDALIRQAGTQANGQEQIHFRSPYGKKLLMLPLVLDEKNKTNVLFNVVPDPPDYRRPPPETLRDFVLTHVKPGSIILLHDGGGVRTETVEATRMIVPALLAEGYELVTVSELLSREDNPGRPSARSGPPAGRRSLAADRR